MTLKIEAGKSYCTRDGRKFGPLRPSGDKSWPWIAISGDGLCWHDDGRGVEKTGSVDLIAEWRDEKPAHIITTDGQAYDLTRLETPFGLLPKAVQEALLDWRHGLEIYMSDETGRHGTWSETRLGIWDWHVLRAKPAPAEVRVSCQRSAGLDDLQHGTCIKRSDNSIDWATWKDAE